MEEVWRKHPIFVGYEGSTFGRIRSWRSNGGSMRWKPKMMKPRISLYPYFIVTLAVNSAKKTVFVHRFIAECFIPNPEDKPEVNHKNGIKTDNQVENLEWVTISENHLHAYRMRLNDKRGEKHHLHKLTNSDVLKIREDYATGKFSQEELAKQYGVTYSSIGMVVSGRRWSHLEGGDPKDHRAGRCCLKKRKLTETEVSQIREALCNGISQRKLAKDYGISQTPIYNIAHNKCYREIS